MKKILAVPLLICLLGGWLGCKPAHPMKVTADPAFNPNLVRSVLVAPFISAVVEGQDPDRKSERIMNAILIETLRERTDYRFVSPDEFRAAIARAGLGADFEAFKENWIRNEEAVDTTFARKIKLALNADAVLIPYVYLWFKDEADYREASETSVTQVGASLTLLDTGSGSVLWKASDENAKEGVRSEGRGEAEAVTVGRRVSGVSGTGKDAYASPPFEDVAILVLKALVDALPPRTALK